MQKLIVVIKVRSLGFAVELGNEIDEVFVAEDTATYREAASELEMPKSTPHRYATRPI